MPEPKQPASAADENEDADIAMDTDVDMPGIPDNMSEHDLDIVMTGLNEVAKVLRGADHIIVSSFVCGFILGNS